MYQTSFTKNYLFGHCRVAADMEELRSTFKEGNHSAFVVGYTGETGKELVKKMLESNIFSRIVLIGRREVKYEDELYKNVACTIYV